MWRRSQGRQGCGEGHRETGMVTEMWRRSHWDVERSQRDWDVEKVTERLGCGEFTERLGCGEGHRETGM